MSSSGIYFTKIHAPSSELDYGFDWSHWLALNETISSSVWEIVTVTGEIVLSRDQISTETTIVFVEGGVVNKSYEIKNTITTNEGRVDSRIIKLKCLNK